jgi:hypothetical protein
VVLRGAQQVVQVLDLRLDLAHEAEVLRHVGAPRRLLRLFEEHVTSGAAQVWPHALEVHVEVAQAGRERSEAGRQQAEKL